MHKQIAALALAMIAIVTASNILVQFPVTLRIGNFDFRDVLTWGALTYPIAFLVTDLANRTCGTLVARRIVFIGFALAVVLSAGLAGMRIAIASGTAFFLAQLLDIAIFNRLRSGAWWRAPLVSSVLASGIDTAIFFSLAFAATFQVLGPGVAFATEQTPLLGVAGVEVPRWVSWALGDLAVKMLVAITALAPYRLLSRIIVPNG